jgi:hypothetical protein
VILFAQTESSAVPDIVEGLTNLWHPATILFLQAVWLIIFLYTGRSYVTGSTISFHIHQKRI